MVFAFHIDYYNDRVGFDCYKVRAELRKEERVFVTKNTRDSERAGQRGPIDRVETKQKNSRAVHRIEMAYL